MHQYGSIEQTKEFLTQAINSWAQGTEYTWAITLKDTTGLIGMIALRVNLTKADFGYVLARPHWNQGFTTEAVVAVVQWAMAQSEVYRVWALCDTENLASARVLEKAGLQREGTLRRWLPHVNVSSEPRDCFCYSIVK